jgi:outer membrane protein OmpA-like peptidoglycan-associated protein
VSPRRLGAACALVGLLAVGTANAMEPRAHFEVAAAHFVGGWQGREIGPGATGAAALELGITPRFGVEARLLGGGFAAGSAPRDPSLASTGSSSLFGGGVGLRLHPFDDLRGLWLGESIDLVRTGSRTRAMFDVRVGWDFRAGDHMQMGPFLGYAQVIQPESGDLRGEDARAVMIGFHLGFDEGFVVTKTVVAAPRPIVAAVVDCAHGAMNDPVSGKPCEAPAPQVAAADDCSGDTCTSESATVRVVGDEIKLDQRVYFDFNEARIRPQSNSILRALAKLIIAHPEYVVVHVNGHTDEIGTEEYNQDLSVRRAEAVRATLIAFGVPDTRLVAAGFGKTMPRSLGHTPDDMQINRRVELIIERKIEVAQ